MRSRESHVHGSAEVAVVEDERQFTTVDHERAASQLMSHNVVHVRHTDTLESTSSMQLNADPGGHYQYHVLQSVHDQLTMI